MKYRKKPIVVEAFRLGFDDPPDWIQLSKYPYNKAGIFIDTLEVHMLAVTGDYIIKGSKGELYPCKAEIFEANYDKEHE